MYLSSFRSLLAILGLATLIGMASQQNATASDPCGMVPPIYTGNDVPITRIGLQQTYVMYKDGVETFVIRPGFSGKVDEFGMLIPFPSPPSLRKVPDDVFEQIKNAVDPPEVVVDLRGFMRAGGGFGGGGGGAPEAALQFKQDAKDKVEVLKEEAVGMYEVAVLEAGSAAALKRWMDQHGYQYPKGMDKVCEEYVQQKWCFVAVKTKVGQKKGIDPTPGQRNVRPELPENSVFDGHVQGMGFRFKTDELVVPMRLSAFNEGDTRNIVYLLTDGPKKIRAIPEEYVMRQLNGQQVKANVTNPLPLRIIGGTEKDIPDYRRQSIKEERNPALKNGIAKELFASDLLAIGSENMSLPHEETEKELLRIGEHFGLRGPEIDNENALALEEERQKTVDKGFADIEKMTLTVVDGDFPREVLAKQNLTFAAYRMPALRNNPKNYDAKIHGPQPEKEGVLKIGYIDWNDVDAIAKTESIGPTIAPPERSLRSILWLLGGAGILALLGTVFASRFGKSHTIVLLFACMVSVATCNAADTLPLDEVDEMIAKLNDSSTASESIQALKEYSKQGDSQRTSAISKLYDVAAKGKERAQRGWAIAAMAEIGGQDVDEFLLSIHADEKQEKVVRTWAAAARVSMTRTIAGLVEKAQLVPQFPALGRPIGMRLVEGLKSEKDFSVEDVIAVTIKVPTLQQALAASIMASGAKDLTKVMLTADDQNVRRQAAGYLGALANQGNGKEVAEAVANAVKFDVQAGEVPWDGGPLFVPGISWGKEDAKNLAGNLVKWFLWADINKKDDAKRQIHNNIRSLGLAQAAGYNSPGWDDVSAVQWLQAWGKAFGKSEVQAILKEQGVLDNGRYAMALDDID
jgi:hypothetical protein